MSAELPTVDDVNDVLDKQTDGEAKAAKRTVNKYKSLQYQQNVIPSGKWVLIFRLQLLKLTLTGRVTKSVADTKPHVVCDAQLQVIIELDQVKVTTLAHPVMVLQNYQSSYLILKIKYRGLVSLQSSSKK